MQKLVTFIFIVIMILSNSYTQSVTIESKSSFELWEIVERTGQALKKDAHARAWKRFNYSDDFDYGFTIVGETKLDDSDIITDTGKYLIIKEHYYTDGKIKTYVVLNTETREKIEYQSNREDLYKFFGRESGYLDF